MTKILNVDDIEIEVEKQSPNHDCKWCVFLKVGKRNKEKLLLMFKINKKPHLNFNHNSGSIVSRSNTVFNLIFKNTDYFTDKYIKFPKKEVPMKQDGLTRNQMLNYLQRSDEKKKLYWKKRIEDFDNFASKLEVNKKRLK